MSNNWDRNGCALEPLVESISEKKNDETAIAKFLKANADKKFFLVRSVLFTFGRNSPEHAMRRAVLACEKYDKTIELLGNWLINGGWHSVVAWEAAYSELKKCAKAPPTQRDPVILLANDEYPYAREVEIVVADATGMIDAAKGVRASREIARSRRLAEIRRRSGNEGTFSPNYDF